uniref:Putative secreted protein n=1 Tax=Anopheles darlingi TaxID=43151 RepID=A0A2M4DRT2_ANODA
MAKAIVAAAIVVAVTRTAIVAEVPERTAATSRQSVHVPTHRSPGPCANRSVQTPRVRRWPGLEQQAVVLLSL